MNDCGCNKMNAEQCGLLRNIDILSFFVVDMVLYLDTHPDDADAQDYLAHYAKLLREAQKEYAQRYCALSQADANRYGATWDWECMPLPWEGGCD